MCILLWCEPGVTPLRAAEQVLLLRLDPEVSSPQNGHVSRYIAPAKKYIKIAHPKVSHFDFVGVPGFEPGVTRTQNGHVSRYTTLRNV